MAVVNISDSNSTFSLWTDEDFGLTLENLRTAYPDVINLINPTLTPRRLLCVRNGKIYNPDGWSVDVIYFVHLSYRPQSFADARPRTQSRVDIEDIRYASYTSFASMDSFIIVKRDSKEVKVQVLSGEVNEETLRRAFLLESDVPVAIYKGDIMLASNNSVFNLGNDWNGQIYLVMWKEEHRSRPSTRMSHDSRSATPSKSAFPLDVKDKQPYNENGNCAGILANCKIYMYYSTFSYVKTVYGNKEAVYSIDKCFVLTAASKHFVVTAAHCLHTNIPKQYKEIRRSVEKHDQILIKSCVDHSEYTVEVLEISIQKDFALLKLIGEKEFPHTNMIHPHSECFKVGKPAICLGMPTFDKINDKLEISTVEVSVPPGELVPYKCRISAIGIPEPLLFTINCGTQHGFSGGGLFNFSNGIYYLLGICIRGRIAPDTYREFRPRSGYHSSAYALPAYVFHDRILQLVEPTQVIKEKNILRSKSSPPEGSLEKRSKYR